MQLLSIQMAALPNRLHAAVRRTREMVYALYAQAVFRLLAVLIGVSVITLPGKRLRWALLRPFARSLAWLTATRFKVGGIKNLLPEKQNCIYVVNHASFLDSYTVCAALPRRFRFTAKSDLAKKWLPANFLGRIGTLFVDRFDPARALASTQSVEQAAILGDSLLFFPEGTFTYAPGLRPFRMGAFVTTASLQLPVIPVALHGTRAILQGNSWVAHRGSITVTFGQAIDPQSLAEACDSEWETVLKLRDLARGQILRHCGEADLGHEQAIPPHQQ